MQWRFCSLHYALCAFAEFCSPLKNFRGRQWMIPSKYKYTKKNGKPLVVPAKSAKQITFVKHAMRTCRKAIVVRRMTRSLNSGNRKLIAVQQWPDSTTADSSGGGLGHSSEISLVAGALPDGSAHGPHTWRRRGSRSTFCPQHGASSSTANLLQLSERRTCYALTQRLAGDA